MARTAERGSRVLGNVRLPERYEVLRRIASGGMASVWCAQDRTLGRRVAIKVLSDPFAHDPVAVRRFQREARTAAHLSSHPHVVTIYDVGEAEGDADAPGRPFIVMECLAGGTVADAVRLRAVSRRQATRWLQQAAAALDHAHGRGVIHRDVKPPNFLLDRDRALYVGDFGIARLGDEETITGSGEMLGTAAYLAPERVRGCAATEASDRYALAVVAYELLVGQRPFAADHFAAQARAHLDLEPPRPSVQNPSLPGAVDAVLARGMAKAPEERWSSCCELATRLERALVVGAPRRRGRRAATPVTAVKPASAVAAGSLAAQVPSAAEPPAAQAAEPPRFLPPYAPPRRHHRVPRRAALLALVAVTAGIAVALASAGHSPTTSHRTAAANAAKAARGRPSGPRHQAAPHPAAISGSTDTTGASLAPSTGAAAGPAALQARGHALLLAGDYPAAIVVLRQAVSSAAPGSLTYAYALFDLGRSLRLGGDPKAAIPVLWRRMQIPNQTGVVRQELDAALRAAGQASPTAAGATAPAPTAPQPPGHAFGRFKDASGKPKGAHGD